MLGTNLYIPIILLSLYYQINNKMTNLNLINFTEKMKAITEGTLHFYIHECNNGFNQACVKHKVNGELKSVFMASNEQETEFLTLNFSK